MSILVEAYISGKSFRENRVVFVINILLPLHNEESNLENLFKNINAQNISNFRILISENNSTDQTRQLISQYLINFEHEIRVEPHPLKSVYEHYSNAIEYFLSRYEDSDKWIILSADDGWIENDFLKICELELNLTNSPVALCGVPAVAISSHKTDTIIYRRNRLLTGTGGFAKYCYFLIPRSNQPMTFFYGMFNRAGIKEIAKFSKRVENFRVDTSPKKERVPAAENFFCFDLIDKLKFIEVDSTLRYTINNRVRKSARKDFSDLGFFEKILRHLQNRCYSFFYLIEVWSYLTLKKKILFSFLCVGTSIIDILDDLLNRLLSVVHSKM